MRVKPTRISQESSIRLHLPDGLPVMRASLYSNNSRMRPTSVDIRWDGDESRRGMYCHILISGIEIRRDGSEGVRKQCITYNIPETLHLESKLQPDEHPDWLDDLVQRYTPPCQKWW